MDGKFSKGLYDFLPSGWGRGGYVEELSKPQSATENAEEPYMNHAFIDMGDGPISELQAIGNLNPYFGNSLNGESAPVYYPSTFEEELSDSPSENSFFWQSNERTEESVLTREDFSSNQERTFFNSQPVRSPFSKPLVPDLMTELGYKGKSKAEEPDYYAISQRLKEEIQVESSESEAEEDDNAPKCVLCYARDHEAAECPTVRAFKAINTAEDSEKDVPSFEELQVPESEAIEDFYVVPLEGEENVEAHRERSIVDDIGDFRPQWESDDSSPFCSKCTVPFSFFRRRHHCRGCGKLFCKLCSDNWLILPNKFKYQNEQRTCEKCFMEQSSIDFACTYDKCGNPKGEVVILLHGEGFTRKSWGLQITELQNKYFLLIPDLPGHGSRWKEPFSFSLAKGVVTDLIEEYAKFSKVILIGYSLGGYVALSYASQHPDLVSGVIIGGAVNELSCSSYFSWMDLLTSSLSGRSLARAVKIAQWLFSAKIHPDVMDELFGRSGNFFQHWGEIKSSASQENFELYLKSYTSPVLFFVAENDSRLNGCRWPQLTKESKLEIIENGNVFMFADERTFGQVNEILEKFVQYIIHYHLHYSDDEELIEEPEEEMTEQERANPYLFTGSWLGDNSEL